MAARPVRALRNTNTWLHIEADNPTTGDLRVHGKQITAVSNQRLVDTYYEVGVTGPIGHHHTDLRLGTAPTEGLWDPADFGVPDPPPEGEPPMADKYLYLHDDTISEHTTITTSAGAADAGKIPSLDDTGHWHPSLLPTGVGADTDPIVASEALAASDLVNVWNSSGVAKARKADATVQGKEAHGFVLSAVASGASATVNFEGTITGLTGLTPGVQYLSTTPGTCAAASPTGSGNVSQRVGFAVSATAMNFQSHAPVVRA